MRLILYAFLINAAWVSNLYADSGEVSGENIWGIFLIILSGIIGYVVGTVKSFREAKQKAYGDIIPPILKMTYNPQDVADEKEYSSALSKLWLYGSKKVTKKMEKALGIMHNPSTGDVTKSLQEAVVEMRKDIQIFSWQKINPEDVGHLYTGIAGPPAREDNDKI